MTIALAEDLPAELLTKVLNHLDFRSIVRCRAICSVFRNLIDASPYFQWKIELGIAGMEDGCSYPLDVSRKMLLDHQQGWQNLRWTSELKIPLHESSFWDISGNVHAQQSTDTSFIHFKQLPSKSRNIAVRDWTIDIRRFEMHDFGFDPGQDLLIMIEKPLSQSDYDCRILLLTLLTGEPHPQVTSAHHLLHVLNGSMTLHARQQTISIFGDNLGILFEDRDSYMKEIVVWNWKTGQILANIIGDSITPITFLDEQYIIFGLDTVPCLLVVNFVAEPPQRRWLKDVENVFRFHFPPLSEGAECTSVTIRADQAPLWEPGSKPSVPFFTARENRLCAISLLVETCWSPTEIHLYALTTLFLSVIEKAGRKSAEFEWHEWGPDGTRMVIAESPFSQIWMRYTSGTRFVSTRKRVGERADYVYVWDFNQSALRRSKTRKEKAREDEEGMVDNANIEECCTSNTVSAPTMIATYDVFLDDVETRLGYREQKWPIPGQPNVRRMMCTEDGIVILYGEHTEVEYHFLTV